MRKMRRKGVLVCRICRFSYSLSLLQLGALYQPKMSLFDWCVYDQLRQILLILPLSLIVFDLN